MKRTAMLSAALAAACQTTTPPPSPMKTPVENLASAPDVARRVAQLPRTAIDYDRSLLNDNERQVVAKLIEASKLIDEIFDRQLLATYTGLMFRSRRFAVGEARGRGTAVQWNWLREHGAIIPTTGGKFTVRFTKMRDAVRDLATELLTIEATGDFNRANALLEKYGKETAEMRAVNATLKDIPVDIWPVFPAAGEK